eukprot:14316663-Alexandrium_andersonii.AAC.1
MGAQPVRTAAKPTLHALSAATNYACNQCAHSPHRHRLACESAHGLTAWVQFSTIFHQRAQSQHCESEGTCE